MTLIDLTEPSGHEERAEHGLPPLVGEFTDLRNAWTLWFAGKKLCGRCRGTGNELYSMYKSCEACGGSGERVG